MAEIDTPMDGPRLLTEWREVQAGGGWSQARTAAALGLDQPTLCKWETGPNRPTLELAMRLEALTGGHVPIEAWGYSPEIEGVWQKLTETRARRKRRGLEQPESKVA